MDPYQPPLEASLAQGEPGNGFLCRLTGSYYQALGWISVTSTVVSLSTSYWTDYLHLDPSFILWFWLGGSLKRGSSDARKAAIALFVFMSALALFLLFLPGATANFGDLEFDRPHPAFFAVIGVLVLIFAIPGVMLLGKRGRAAFPKQKSEVLLK